MRYRRLWVLPVLAVILSSLGVCVAAQVPLGRVDPPDMKNIMLVKDIKPGMKGYGKTVFRGTKIETFQVEVLGVLKKVNSGTDLILVKMTGGPMTARGANLIQGMSGSPVYINGKIIGAFAYGEPFIKEPIGMVTPIQYMFDSWDVNLPTKPSSFYPFITSDLDQPIPLGGKSYGKVSIDFGASGDKARLPRDPGTLVFQPLSTSIMVSGLSPRIMSWLDEQLEPLNMHAMTGPGRTDDQLESSPALEPGSAVAVSLVTGDVEMTGIGTVTYRRGNRILAFGHPMLSTSSFNGLGPIAAPMSTAYVYDVFPSVYVSSKVAAAIKPIGRVFQDRPWGIAGEMGPVPDMIPVTVHVMDRSTKRAREFNTRVINHPLLTSNFAVASAAEAIFDMRGSPSDATARIKVQVTADEVGTITRENTFFDPVSIDMASMNELAQILSMLQFNAFHPVAVKKIEVWVDITPSHQTAKLERIFLKESKFKPGDTVEVGAVLKPYKGERLTRTIQFVLPKNTPNGRLALQVRGGMSPPLALGQEGGGGSSAQVLGGPTSTTGTIETLQQLIKKYLEKDKNNELVARIIMPRSAPSIAGEKLSGLPPSIADAMKSTKSTMLGSEREEIKQVLSTDYVIFGSQVLTITVQREDKREKKSPPKPPSESNVQPPSGDSSSQEETGRSSDETDEDGTSSILLGEVTESTYATIEELVEPAQSSQSQIAPIQPVKEEVTTVRPSGSDESMSASSAPASPSSSSTTDKPVGRVPTTWRQTLRTEFQTGTFKNISASTGDLLTLSGSIEPLYESTETYVWCMLPDGQGNVYAGTGNHGLVYKVAADGTASVFCDTRELEVHSLAKDAAGNIYAGTSPNGVLYKVDSAGKAAKLLDADEKYIVALALDSKGNVYAATGDKCKVYKISPEGKVDVVLDTSEYYALSMAVDRNDNVYVGTGQNGIIYKISPSSDVTILYDAAEDAVTSLAVDSNDVLFAGTSPKGVIYKLTPGATPKAVYDKAGAGIVGISADGDGSVYAVSGSSVFRILADDSVYTLDNKHDLQFLSAALADSHLYVGTGNIGSIYQVETGKATEGTYESAVHDCTSESRWGIIDWVSDLPKGTSVSLQTRTGYVAEPDSTWSVWSAPYSSPGSEITSPAGRYIQFMATLKTADASTSPKLSDVSIVYLPKNQTPKVILTAPKVGEKWSKKKTIKWTGTDPDKDTLVYEVFCTSDGGATWKPLGDRIRVAAPAAREHARNGEESANGSDPSEPITVDATDPEQMLRDMAAELDKHPEIPQDVKDKLMEQAPSMIEAASDEIKSNGNGQDGKTDTVSKSPVPTRLTSYTWDTSRFPDGIYRIKVVASDKLSNPTDAMTAEIVSEPITVSNKAPRLGVFKKTLTVQADKSVRVEGVAYDSSAGIAGVQYRLGSGDWAAASATDGIFDSSFETFVIATEPLDKGQQTIEVKVIDQAGNSATAKVPAKVE